MFTIGHGNRTLEQFLELLIKYGIKYLIDVRSMPYSKFNPHFNQDALKYSLDQNGITYVFMGDTIGGRPADKSCYDEEGKVDYDAIELKEFYKNGIERLRTAYSKGIPVALMCSESKPTECHRSKLIGRTLSREKVLLEHIDETGILKGQISVMNELNKGLSEVDLFGNRISLTSRKSYHEDDENP